MGARPQAGACAVPTRASRRTYHRSEWGAWEGGGGGSVTFYPSPLASAKTPKSNTMNRAPDAVGLSSNPNEQLQNRIWRSHPHCSGVDSERPLPALPVVSLLAECANHPAHRYAYERLIARRLKYIRTVLMSLYGEAYSQRNVAAALGRSQTWLSNLERAERRCDANELRTLAAMYQFEPGHIMAEPSGAEEEVIYVLHVGAWWDANPHLPKPPVVAFADDERRNPVTDSPSLAD
jgi:hypothetical protein